MYCQSFGDISHSRRRDGEGEENSLERKINDEYRTPKHLLLDKMRAKSVDKLPKKGAPGGSGLTSWSLWILIGGMTVLVCIGILFSAAMIPSESLSGPSTNSNLQVGNEYALNISKTIQSWLPAHHAITQTLPDWSQEFWTPIDVDVDSSDDPMVVLCKLNFKQYFQQPHFSPMFRDLEAKSSCVASNRRRERLSTLLNEVERLKDSPEGRVVKPSGFVFHESRVGSTLVANLLACDPFALVFSESTPIANAILHCSSCSHERQVKLFRDILTLMGRSPFHNKLFVKFQSITTTKIQIALEVRTPIPFLRGCL